MFVDTVLNLFQSLNHPILFTYAGNLVTFTKFLSSGMKCETSEPDSPKIGHIYFFRLNILKEFI